MKGKKPNKKQTKKQKKTNKKQNKTKQNKKQTEPKKKKKKQHRKTKQINKQTKSKTSHYQEDSRIKWKNSINKGKIVTASINIHSLGAITSVKSNGIKLGLWAQTSPPIGKKNAITQVFPTPPVSNIQTRKLERY